MLALALLAFGCGPVRAGHQPWQPPDYWSSEQRVEVEGLDICYLEAGPPDAEQTLVRARWSAGKTGTIYTGAAHGTSLEQLLKGSQ